jgi:hypothetical protein
MEFRNVDTIRLGGGKNSSWVFNYLRSILILNVKVKLSTWNRPLGPTGL